MRHHGSLAVALAAGALIIAACASTPVTFETSAALAAKDRSSAGRIVTARACGFQLLLFIPIGVNTRQERAYASLKAEAGGEPIVDVEMEESWTYGFVGTNYCTSLRARVLAPGS